MASSPKIIRLEPNGPDGVLPEMECDPAGFQSPLPVQHLHVYFSDPAIGMSVGIWDTTTMQEAFGPYPGDEFIWVLNGAFEMLDGDGNAMHCPNGSCVSFRNGAPVSWKQEGCLKKFFITYLNPNHPVPEVDTAEGAIRVLDPDAPLEMMDNTDPFEIEGEVPVQKNHTEFTNDAGDFIVGTWESGPMVSRMRPFPSHEFVRMLEGEVTITEEDGSAQTFRAGDCFFVPKGTVCSWDIKDRVKKHYATLTAG
ncbi:MAG: cupin domain-containing protein [Thalassovita sp.]|nr:cupin domain-containing protein [Thalassovita sp.]